MPARTTRTRYRRTVVVLALVAGVVVALGFGLHAVWNTAKSHLVSDGCTVAGFEVDTGQAAVAATMVGAVTTFRVSLPERAAVLVLGAALQESKLTNVAPGAGDRDSVGVLQQRPSQGWGSVVGKPDTIAARTARLTDVGEATREFLNALIKIDGWQSLPLAVAVQRVQISADGSAYAQHEPEAQALADALTGTTPAAMSCTFGTPSKVAASAVVAEQAREQLGIDTPVSAVGSVRVPGAHWQTATWFVANGDRLGIEQVTYAGRRWTRSDGWHTDPTVSAAAVVATMYRA